MPIGSDIRIRWVLDVVDKGAGDKLLAQDRAIRSSLNQTDSAYKRTATTAVSASAKQAEASRGVTAATEKEGRARLAVTDTLKRFNAAQADALAIGSRVLSQVDKTTGAVSRQAAATKRLADEESRRGKLGRGLRGAAAAESSALSGVGGVVGGVGTIAKGIGIGVLGTATGLTIGGLKRGTEVRAGAAGLAGLTGLDPRTATALAVIAQAEQVQARGLGQAFSTLGKQVTGFQHELATGKPGKTAEAFKQLGIGPGQARGLQNNLPALFDLVFQRAQKLPAAQQATVLKTFLGRGATLAGQIELGGPLQKQIGTVREQLGGLDPKKLQDLHETEIHLKEATVGLELSFAQTFGPALITIFNKIAPAIKPIGDALKTAIVEPIKFIKDNAPAVIGSIISGFTGTPRPGKVQGVPPILRARGTTAGTRSTTDPEAAARAGGRTPSTLEAIGTVIGKVARTVATSVTFIATTAAEAGKELFNAFKPAAPFLQHVLLPVLKEFGKATLEVGKFVIGTLVVAFHVLTFAIKIVAATLGGLTEAGRATGRFLVKLNGDINSVAGSIVKFIGGVASKIGGFAGRVGAAAAGLASAAAHGIASLPGKVGHYAAQAGSSVVGTLSGWVGKAGNVGGKVAGAIVHGIGSLPGKVANLAGSILEGFADLGKKIVHAIVTAIKEAPSAILDAIKSLIPGGIVGKIEGLFGGSGGAVHPRGFRKHFAAGGLVDAMVSPGEQVLYGGSSWMVPGARTAADSVYAQLPVGAAVLTGDGQRRMSAGSSLSEAIATQAPHFRTGGFVSTAYGPPWGGIEGGGTTATGIDLSKSPHLYIVAVDPSVIPLHSKLKISPNPFGYAGAFSAEDTGGAIKGNRIDFYDWKGRGDQNAWGRRNVHVSIGGKGGPIGTSTTGGTETVTQMLTLGRSRVRAGLLPDALQQGIEAGTAGLTAAEIARANRGVRGAEGSPLSKAIAEALGPTTRELKTAAETGQGGKPGKLPTGVSIPSGTWNPSRKPIDRWIQPYLSYGATHGWPGIVESGFRTLAEGTAIYNSGKRPAAKPGTSKHEQPNYPGGAVDVSDAAQLASALAKRPGPHLLQWAGSRDPVHFSHPVGGSYREGGVVGRATRVIGPDPAPSISERFKAIHSHDVNVEAAPSRSTMNAFRALVQGAWEALKAQGALPPKARFPHYVTGSFSGGSYTQGSTIHFPWERINQAVLLPQGTRSSNHARLGIIHEMAHTMQSPSVRASEHGSVPLAEGGAQAWADEWAPRYYSSPYRNEGDSNYAGYVQMVRRKGLRWINRTQFGYRGGGLVGFQGGGIATKLSAVAGKTGAFTALLRSYEESLVGLTIGRLNQLVRSFTASARKGGSSAVVQSFQALISAVEAQIGQRIGELRNAITKRGAALERGAASVSRYLAFKGIDPSSQEGLKVQIAGDAQTVAGRRRSVAEAQRAVAIAKRTGNRKALEDATDELTKAQEDLQDAVVKGVEDGRSLMAKATEDVRNSAQEIVDLAGSSVQFAQGSLAGLDTAQRLNRTSETPGGENQKASAIQAEVLPVLQGAKRAAENQLEVLKGTNASATELATATLAVQSAGNEVASALAEATELIRKAAEQAAEELVESAQHRSSLDQAQATKLELEQRIAGTFDAGGQQRADFIRNTLIPDLQNEITALVTQQQVAEEQGNPKLAAQIAEAIAGKQNGVLEDILQANEDVAANTNPNHKVGGTLGFAFGSETLTDSIIAGSGA